MPPPNLLLIFTDEQRYDTPAAYGNRRIPLPNLNPLSIIKEEASMTRGETFPSEMIDSVEAPFPAGSTHFHSNALDLIVGDGNRQEQYVLLWRFVDGQFEGPRVLALHRGSFHVQILHVHPRFSPTGSQVLYTADPNGYGNVHLADVPDFNSLPLLSDVLKTR